MTDKEIAYRFIANTLKNAPVTTVDLRDCSGVRISDKRATRIASRITEKVGRMTGHINAYLDKRTTSSE